MAIETIGYIEPGTNLSALAGTNTREPVSNFANWLDKQLVDMNESIKSTDQLVRDLAVGENNNLHHVMLEIEKAKTSFQLALQVRNRLLEGYQEIMRMQV
jgi:flagellar hook-basal body complex protein FliE